MMNKWIVLLLLSTLVACDRKSYVNHKLKFEKVAENCSDRQTYFRMTSNFGGERYEFEKCLPANFEKNMMNSERKGDTVVVSFKQAVAGEKTAVFHITLDIDSYPRYTFISIDGDTYTLTTSQN